LKNETTIEIKMNNNKKIFITLLVILFLFQSCGLVWICNESKQSIKKSSKYTHLTGVSIPELKQIIYSDTLNYKVLIFYSPCCGACAEEFKITYKTAYAKLETAKFYFIASDCGGLKYIDKFFGDFAKDEVKYYIKDSSAKFETSNVNRLNNILNYIFEEPSYSKIDACFGIPLSCIVSPNNKLKKAKCKYLNDTVLRTAPLFLHEFESRYNYDLNLLDFDEIDSLNVTFYEYCYPGECK